MMDFDALTRDCEAIWQSCGGTKLRLPAVKKELQKENMKQLHAMRKDWQTFMDRAMEHLQEEQWKQEMDLRVLELLRKESILNFNALEPQVQQEFLHITKQFIRDAMRFDCEIQLADIMQAMRNVWIILLLECMLERPLCYHKAIFAYSMLYPYTDNFLDDPGITPALKKAFNHWLTKRLKGEVQRNTQPLYQEVDKLITMIEETFHRPQFPQVYEALLRIQEGQVLSLCQGERLSKDEILKISIYKGGASVLADGCLMDGTLQQKEAMFCMSYGFLLQVADDIQDMEEDRQAQQYTLASILSSRQERLKLAEQLHTYIHEVLYHHCPIKKQAMISFVEQNCRFLLLASLAKQLHMLPAMFAIRLRKSLPIELDEFSLMLQDSSSWLQSNRLKTVLHAYTKAI